MVDAVRMRVGVVGLGRAGQVHLDAWQKIEGVRIAAVCDPAVSSRRRARQAGLPVYTNPLAMLAREDLDAVSIASPPLSHAPIAIAFLRAGGDGLCEKALAINGRAAPPKTPSAA